MGIVSSISCSDCTTQETKDQPQSYLDLKRHIAHLHTLQEISRKLNSKLDLEDALTSILDEAIRAIGAERGCLLLANAATGELEVHLSRHLQPSDLNGKSFQLSRTVIERVWIDGKPVLTANALEDPELGKADSVISYTLRSILCVPLHVQGQRIGALYLDNRLRAGQFHEDDLALATAIADQAAIALRNAQLHQEAVDRSRKMCRLHAELQQRLGEMQSVLAVTRALVSEISLNNRLEFIMTQAEHLTNAEGSAVLLLSDDGQWLEVATPGESWLHMKAGSRIPVHGTLAELAIASRQVQTSNHAQNDNRTALLCALLQSAKPHSLLCAPLVTQDEELGVLLVWNKHEFTGHDRRLMGLFADHAALAIHNARLHLQNHQLAIERERHRLARELHDTVTQSLYSIAMAAQTSLKLLGQVNANGRASDPIEHILALSQTALAEMREQLYDLYPTALADKGVVEALAHYCDRLRVQYPLAIEFTACPEPALSMHQREALYYIAREALWNVVKHAGATHVHVSLTTENGQATLSIQDNGAGFDPSIFAQEATIGLRNMEERTKTLGGTFHLESRSGYGTRVTVLLPIQASEKCETLSR